MSSFVDSISFLMLLFQYITSCHSQYAVVANGNRESSNGQYTYTNWDDGNDSPVYYCSTCGYQQEGLYLFGLGIYDGVNDAGVLPLFIYNWIIGPVPSVNQATDYCTIRTQSTPFAFRNTASSCSPWLNYINEEWVHDYDMKVIEYEWPTESPTLPPPTSAPTFPPPTYAPTIAPTICHVDVGKFCGYTLFVRGFNIFTAKTSGNALLDIDYIKENTENWSDEGSTCSFSSLEFDSSFKTYTEYAKADAQSVTLAFSAQAEAGGSLSTARVQTKQYSASSQSYIYSVHLQCAIAKASVTAYNEIYFSSNFVNNLRILPQSFDKSSDNLAIYIDFWDSFGTHLIKTAELGGSIRGAITVNKCSVDESYSDTTSYQACLNGEYKGVAIAGCNSESTSTTEATSAQGAITNTQITVNGGDTAQFTNVFNSFGSKENDFQDWIDDLKKYPDIVGGDLDEIHDVIQKCVLLGNHKLNDVLSQNNYVDDDTWILIANALENAYVTYSEKLMEEDASFTDSECAVDCNEGVLDAVSCSCTGCGEIASCCGFSQGNRIYTTNVFLGFCFVIYCFLFFCSFD